MDFMLIDNKTKRDLDFYLPNYETSEKLAHLFSLFSDTSRLRLLSALSISAMCVTDLSRLLQLNQTTVSHQLKLLKNTNMVKSTRQGKVIFYQLNSNKINDVLLCGVDFLGF